MYNHFKRRGRLFLWSRGQGIRLGPFDFSLNRSAEAEKHSLELSEHCYKGLGRLPLQKAQALIDEVLAGGKHRRKVSNPTRYILHSLQRIAVPLGVEQASGWSG